MTTSCGHHHAVKPTKRQVTAALKAAEARSLSAGTRLTPLRKRVLELLVGAGGPVKAYDFVSLVKAGEAAAPTTIYRTLDALVGAGLAHRIASLNAYVTCHGHVEAHAAWFLICDCCGEVEEVAEPATETLTAIRGGSDFRIRTLEAHGRCRHCQD